MTGRIKHAQRSKRSSHKQPDYRPFVYRVNMINQAKQSEGLIARLLAPFMGRKHDA